MTSVRALRHGPVVTRASSSSVPASVMAPIWRRSSSWSARRDRRMDGENAPERGRRIAVVLEYDGTAYCGSQYQENGPSIQSALEAAIKELTAETVRAAFAGRTDAHVHALGQVAAFVSS